VASRTPRRFPRPAATGRALGAPSWCGLQPSAGSVPSAESVSVGTLLLLASRRTRRLPAVNAHLVALARLDTRRPFVPAKPACQLLRHSSASPGISTCASLSSRSIARPDPTNPADRAVGLSPGFAALDNTLVPRSRLPCLSRRLPASRAHLVALALLDMRRPVMSAQRACELLGHSEIPSGSWLVPGPPAALLVKDLGRVGPCLLFPSAVRLFV